MATIVGTEGPDSLTGSLANDTIIGLGGNDTIVGLTIADSLSGGEGDDQFFLAFTTEQGVTVAYDGVIDGGNGDDTLTAYEHYVNRSDSLGINLTQATLSSIETINLFPGTVLTIAQADGIQ